LLNISKKDVLRARGVSLIKDFIFKVVICVPAYLLSVLTE